MSDRLIINNLTFELRWSVKRKTVGITVERDGSLTLRAPINCPLETIERIAKAKQHWVYTKLAQKRLYAQPRDPQEFVTGEGCFYLGRSYRLFLVDTEDDKTTVPALRLHRGRFELRRDEWHRAQQHFVNWYKQHGQPWIERRVTLLADRIGVEPGVVAVRDLGFRWGSCTQDGKLIFHWRTILLPPRIVEYIIAHELVHLHEPYHSQSFWQRLERGMPDYAGRKHWLAEHGGQY